MSILCFPLVNLRPKFSDFSTKIIWKIVSKRIFGVETAVFWQEGSFEISTDVMVMKM